MLRSALLNVMIKAARKASRTLKRDFGELEHFARKDSVPTEPGRRKRARTSRVFVERLEERCMLSLLGLSQLATKPDIASGSRSNLSYTQIGNNANPFQYSAIPLVTEDAGWLGGHDHQPDEQDRRQDDAEPRPR